MGDDHHRDAQLPVDVLDQGQDGVGGVGVQRTGGLIAEQDLGVSCQCAGNGNALLLAAGKLGRVGVSLIGQAYHLKQLPGALFRIRLFYPGQLHRETDVLQAAALHQQVELLEDHRDLTAALAQLGGRQRLHGGAVEFMKWLTRNLRYPLAAERQKIEGRVVVQFVVERDGSITGLKVVQPAHPYLDREAMRVMNTMPKWTAGMQNDRPCRTMVCIPVVFKL